MKKGSFIYVFFLITVIFSMVPFYNVHAYDWLLDVPGGSFAYETFEVSKSNKEVTFKITVESGGPISFYVLNESAFNAWQGNSEVIAYLGAYNVSEGQTVYATGRLGSPGTYYAIVDNRFVSENAVVGLTVIERVPFPSLAVVGLGFVALLLLRLKHQRRTK